MSSATKPLCGANWPTPCEDCVGSCGIEEYEAESAATTANSAVISWTDKLLAIAADGIEVQLAYLPRKFWPHEADENPPNEVWQAWATTVPGTDMCTYGPHKGATPDDAMSALWDELYKGGDAT